MIGTSHGHNDYFRGDKAWFHIVLLTIGYLLSRGLASLDVEFLVTDSGWDRPIAR